MGGNFYTFGKPRPLRRQAFPTLKSVTAPGARAFQTRRDADADAGGPKTPKVPPDGTGQNLRDELGSETAAPYNTQLKK